MGAIQDSICGECNKKDSDTKTIVNENKILLDKNRKNKKNEFGELHYNLEDDNVSVKSTSNNSVSPIKINFSKLEYLDGTLYFGQCYNNLKHGKGRLTLPTGIIYEGEFFNDLYHGKGTIIFADESTYKGDFAYGMMCGRGIYTFSKNEYYDGSFKNNMKNGMGKDVYSDGSYYVGNFQDNKRHLKGKLVISNDEYYEGEFYFNNIQGMVSFITNLGYLCKKR